MNKAFITLISFSALLFSCTKIQTPIYTDKVQVRIENSTGFTLENAQIADINYGNVTNHQLTDYKILNEPIYSGYCLFNAGGFPSFAGVGGCGTPYSPPFDHGYYTFKVMPAVNGYSSITITKE